MARRGHEERRWQPFHLRAEFANGSPDRIRPGRGYGGANNQPRGRAARPGRAGLGRRTGSQEKHLERRHTWYNDMYTCGGDGNTGHETGFKEVNPVRN